MRAFERFMFVGFAGELAIKYGVVCWRAETSYNSAVACFNSWLEDKDGVGDDENRQIIDQVKSFFELHGHSRFYNLNKKAYNPYNPYKSDEYIDQKILNMAGYKQTDENGTTFLFHHPCFKRKFVRTLTEKLLSRC